MNGNRNIKMVKKGIFLFMILLLNTGILSAQETVQRLSLTHLLDSALQRNYLLQANEKNTAIKQAEIEILNTNYLPKIAASANFSYWKWLMPNKEKILGNTLTDMYTDFIKVFSILKMRIQLLKRVLMGLNFRSGFQCCKVHIGNPPDNNGPDLTTHFII